MAQLNDRETAKVALKQVWQELAVIVDAAKASEAEAAEHPSLLSDPRIAAELRWAHLFESEISDVQTVYKSVAAGARLPADAIRSATDTGRKLLDIHSQARERVSSAEPIANS